MNVEKAKQFISSQGWTPQERKRQRGGMYLYAARWVDGKTKWRYIGPVAKMDHISEQEVLEKLNKVG